MWHSAHPYVVEEGLARSMCYEQFVICFYSQQDVGGIAKPWHLSHQQQLRLFFIRGIAITEYTDRQMLKVPVWWEVFNSMVMPQKKPTFSQ